MFIRLNPCHRDDPLSNFPDPLGTIRSPTISTADDTGQIRQPHLPHSANSVGSSSDHFRAISKMSTGKRPSRQEHLSLSGKSAEARFEENPTWKCAFACQQLRTHLWFDCHCGEHDSSL
jgi:hypothetical protein